MYRWLIFDGNFYLGDAGFSASASNALPLSAETAQMYLRKHPRCSAIRADVRNDQTHVAIAPPHEMASVA